MHMKQLLIAAHGSRRASSNDKIRAPGARVSANLGGAFERVEVAFLEIASPTIESVLAELVSGEATEVVVLPYFLSAGNHVVQNIPREIEKVLAQWPDKKINVLPHIGALDTMAQVITEACKNSSSF